MLSVHTGMKTKVYCSYQVNTWGLVHGLWLTMMTLESMMWWWSTTILMSQRKEVSGMMWKSLLRYSKAWESIPCSGLIAVCWPSENDIQLGDCIFTPLWRGFFSSEGLINLGKTNILKNVCCEKPHSYSDAECFCFMQSPEGFMNKVIGQVFTQLNIASQTTVICPVHVHWYENGLYKRL